MTKTGASEVSLESQRMTTEQREAADDAALAQLEAKHGAATEPDPQAAMDTVEALTGAGDPVQPQDAAHEPEATPEPAAPTEAATAPETEQPAKSEERKLAEAAIRQDGGWTPGDLAGLSDERILAIAEHRRTNQANVNAAFAELNKLRADGVPAGERTAGEKEAEAPQSQTVEKLATELGLDEDGIRTLTEWQQALVKPQQAELASVKAMVAELQKAPLRVEADLARRDLAERFPQIADASSSEYQSVLSTMETLSLQPGMAERPIAERMEKAAFVTFADQIAAQASEAQKKLRNAQTNGQPITTTTEQPKQRGPLSQDERESAVLMALDGGGDASHDARLNEAKRLGGMM